MTLFHPLGFASTDEAAAFIAALSRALNSPERGAAATATGSVEVWIDRGPSQSAVVYLSDAALDTAVAAFPPVPVQAAVSQDTLPAGCRQIIGGGPHPSWGMAEVQRLLASLALCLIAMGCAGRHDRCLREARALLSVSDQPVERLPHHGPTT